MKQIVLTVAVTAPRSSLTAGGCPQPGNGVPTVPSYGGYPAR